MVSEEQGCDCLINLYCFRFMCIVDRIVVMMEELELMIH
jgi:hypothetical protein